MLAAVSCSCTGCTVLCNSLLSRVVQFSKNGRRFPGYGGTHKAPATIYRSLSDTRRVRAMRSEFAPSSYAQLMRSMVFSSEIHARGW
jgi:hypothetical protein